MNTAVSIHHLAKISKQVIQYNQHSSGGYVACPLFSHYTFSWLRDGSFIAYAMDITGERESSEQFHQWVNRVLARQKGHVDYLLQKHQNGEAIAQHEFLHTRYHLDGRDDDHSEWGHFQLDGYGAWLWGLVEHWKASGQSVMPESFRVSVELTIRYLCAFWQQPNFDCWEERNDQIHPSTLACIYGGLTSIKAYVCDTEMDEVIGQIRRFLLEQCVHPETGCFVKSIRPIPNGQYEISFDGVDASLMWLTEPFQVFPPEHPMMSATLGKIKADLQTDHGGVRRYVGDEYYGGGEWLLLTAWQGWIEHKTGKREQADQALEWISRQADSLGRMPEQVPHTSPPSDSYNQWVERWGTPASPLLWSHAMYLVLYSQLYE
ncbi:glycoside hydrolase family 15 protein [Paenibacillus sp. UNC451MF]|uniref:glycoside hydrolase family 15 protein n=1 Tax=Paenibacillus sp. UNC451MF TaxID=1449063 RepID=UPI0006898141|nr:glycoside hydrolase family 15 protein [Paenibacillus sp. UNC451MF]